MGLAAAQARLLTITSRKADCEFQSMRLSHQKIALSRNMTDISNEYQNALNQTSLVYDYYGNNDTSTALSYGLLMTPSELNGFMPTLTTNSAGKVVLNSRYAVAARAAGIPVEGLGCLPSTDIRNKFLDGLASSGIITSLQAETYKAIEYSQQIGLGTTDLVTTTLEQFELNKLLDYYLENKDHTVYNGLFNEIKDGLEQNLQHKTENGDSCNKGHFDEFAIFEGSGEDIDRVDDNIGDITIADLLNDNYSLVFTTKKQCKSDDGTQADLILEGYNEVIKESGLWEWMFEEFANMLSVPGDIAIENCIMYAEEKTRDLLNSKNLTNVQGVYQDVDNLDTAGNRASYMMGLFGASTSANKDAGGINISLIAEAYLTYFAQEMQGKYSEFEVLLGPVSNSHLIKSDSSYKFNVPIEIGVNADQSLNSGFYDGLFNQICLNGWVENTQIDDNEYLHQMFQTGKLFISTCNDDGFYYQGNYTTNKFVKEIADEEAIARAEAKYNTEKQKINSKEEVLDMKMKNLDTEISSLTTEYDTIKSLISNNVKKAFTRYEA